MDRQASFANEPKSVVKQRVRLCDLLFATPEVDNYVGLSFPDSDTKSNDMALMDLLSYQEPGVTDSNETFKAATDTLLQCEAMAAKTVASSKVKQAVSAITRTIANLPPKDERERFLCLECKYLLQGFLHPIDSAKALHELSEHAVATSPTLAQVCLVHSINLYKQAGLRSTATKLFNSGREVFLRCNPTRYADGFWDRHKVVGTRSTFVNGKIITTPESRFIEPHLRWRF